MVDFLYIATRPGKRGWTEIYPKFIVMKSNDLMIRGGDFYAIWLADKGLWSTDEQDVFKLIDAELDNYKEQHKDAFDGPVRVLHMWDSENGMIDRWRKYCQSHMRDSYRMLDENLTFANTKTKKSDYASIVLPYALEPGSMTAYDQLMSVLYSPEERHKLEWAVGSVVNGDSKKLQKFIVLYGAPGTGKGTFLKIVASLFDGYCATFEAKTLGSSNNAFALEAFRTNPLVAISEDSDLSRIEDNTRLNSLVSHELMTVNEKFKSTYTAKFKSLLFIGTNKPVKITDAKSGLIRRLIDVNPTGDTIADQSEYLKLMAQIKFELGAIASHCRDVYEEDPHRYDDYVPISMLGATNDFYNFIVDSYFVFKKEDGTTLKAAWEMYKTYCEEARVPYPYPQRIFKEELKNYFEEYSDRRLMDDGSRVRSYYSKFCLDKFEDKKKRKPKKDLSWLKFDSTTSILDDLLADYPAQYASSEGTPIKAWDKVKTTLSDIDTTRLHYVRVPEKHIVIDFDIPDADGNKWLEKNMEEAEKWPPTYAELSKSGQGIHLHYIYAGDVSKLERLYADHVEIKVFTGKASLRRMRTKCNNLPIATLSSGLPLKGDDEVAINPEVIKDEEHLRRKIAKALRKEVGARATKPSIDYINKVLDDAYKSGMTYDVSQMAPDISTFASMSTHNAQYCMKVVANMKFMSADKERELYEYDAEAPLIFYDVEVFPNLFLVNWKIEGEGKKVVRMINPTPTEIATLIAPNHRLVGFNCRRYDNHLLYAAQLGFTNQELFELSSKIVSGSKNAFFREAYDISYTDVYDFSSKKQSLKKFEIELNIHHDELGLPWNKPVPEEMWERVAEYCDYDVLATEAVFHARKADWIARQILADIAGMTVNDTTNSLTARIIFGSDRNPQSQFNYRDMGDVTQVAVVHDACTKFDKNRRPIFDGYKYDAGKSTYWGEEVGEGGYVYSEPGMYGNVALLDIASMHPSSIVAEDLFGPKYTQRFRDILNARIAIKHKDYDTARKLFDGKLAKYIEDESTAKDLAQALKIAINSVYGLTSAKFDNQFRDVRNKDNIVAKRGALFMINLKHEVQKRGFIVAHIKTDSIKIPDATPEIIDFVTKYGAMYGYTFEHEATYDRMCIVNEAVYIAKYKDGDHAGEWTATGTQFQVPYVFKSLFSKEPIIFSDLRETKQVQTALYLDMNETLPNDQHDYKYVGKVGSFCPMLPGCGGGILLREVVDKKTGERTGFAAAGGTKGYRWLESELVMKSGSIDNIDKSYYEALADEAIKDISQYGDFTWFVSDDPYVGPSFENGKPVYWDETTY